jgi:hypothetical protein
MAEVFFENDEIEKARRQTTDAIAGQYFTIARSIVFEIEKLLDRTGPCPNFYVDDDGMLGYIIENNEKVPWKNISPVLNRHINSSSLLRAMCLAWPMEKLEVRVDQIKQKLIGRMGVDGLGAINATFAIKEPHGIIVRNQTNSVLIPTKNALETCCFYLGKKEDKKFI